MFLRCGLEKKLLDSRNELKKICEFLNLEFNEEMLNFYLKNSENNLEPNDFDEWKKETKKPVNRDNANKWIVDLNKNEKQLIESVTKKLLVFFGYPLYFDKSVFVINFISIQLKIKRFIRLIRFKFISEIKR